MSEQSAPWWKQAWVKVAGVVVALGMVGLVLDSLGLLDDGPAERDETAEAAGPEPERGASEPEPEPEERTNEDRFLEAVYEAAREEGSGIHGKGDEWVTDLGYAVCEDIEDGMAPTEVVISLKRANEGARLDPVGPVASQLVGNAQLYLCPDV